MLLAIDTATRTLSLALHDRQRLIVEMSWQTANAHTVELTPAVVDLCRRAGIVTRSLTHIAIAQGPGSFSGLRIGIGFAKGLALALSVPLIPIPTLDIVAAAQPMFKGTLMAVAQVGRGRVCAGGFQWKKNEWIATSAVEIVEWPTLLASINTETMIAGEIDDDAHDLITASQKPIRLARPALALRRAGVLADLAWARAESFIHADPTVIVPLYVNQPGLPHG
jgi:tRNA threonylcarbamoyladenosine biosynthesis protein TsaB